MTFPEKLIKLFDPIENTPYEESSRDLLLISYTPKSKSTELPVMSTRLSSFFSSLPLLTITSPFSSRSTIPSYLVEINNPKLSELCSDISASGSKASSVVVADISPLSLDLKETTPPCE
ncbi:hypothetical protein [uncultured Sutterella sp.]|uniref:hypothetical protein n=1 Tax=uncultured Sutterella sp. TaxID=286133 RepID=UPI00260C8358|nr:hypothetical protein [uncultured Sutterella sp.]